MRKIAIALASTAALLAGPALSARERLTGEQELAKMLEGRVAGEPVSCIPLNPDHIETREQLMAKYVRLQAQAAPTKA